MDILSSRFWNSVFEKPKFWMWARLRVDRDNYSKVLQRILAHVVPDPASVEAARPAFW